MSQELIRLLEYFNSMYENGEHDGKIVLLEDDVKITLNIKMEGN